MERQESEGRRGVREGRGGGGAKETSELVKPNKLMIVGI
jgi:hypothetical protein